MKEAVREGSVGAQGSTKGRQLKCRGQRNTLRLGAVQRPSWLLAVPNFTPRHYHIIVLRERGSLFIYPIVIARILLLIAVLDSPLWYRTSLRRLLKVMEHNDVSEWPLKLRSGVGQCEHSAT